MPLINYDRIPFHEKKSTGERVIENAFYMPKYEEDRQWYYGYSANDFFGMETKKIVPLSEMEMKAIDW